MYVLLVTGEMKPLEFAAFTRNRRAQPWFTSGEWADLILVADAWAMAPNTAIWGITSHFLAMCRDRHAHLLPYQDAAQRKLVRARSPVLIIDDEELFPVTAEQVEAFWRGGEASVRAAAEQEKKDRAGDHPVDG